MSLLVDNLAPLIPHGYCLSWQPRLMALHIIADAVTAIAYATIPVMLIHLVRSRKDLQFGWMFMLFGAFILACGATHVMSLWTLWYPDYLAAGVIKAITALASVGTAMVLWPLIPKAIALPGPAQWEAVNLDLRKQVQEREAAEREVRRLNEQLEARVAARTAELEESNRRLEQLHGELEKRVHDRTRELEKAQAALVSSAREAGMAEIATNVLHNVGNVLNSATVTAGLLSQRIRQSKLPGLAKAVELMKTHQPGLGAFMEDDPKGRMLPDYLGQLSETLALEQRGMRDELEQMGKSIEHIKDVVATQQSYAGGLQMVTLSRIEDLIEDALRMNAGALTRHKVLVERLIEPMPDVPLDRHRVLQILVNLISNAKEAMKTVNAKGCRLRITARLDDERRLHLGVQDEGDGIPAENMASIFAHGFTTRINGHGFGLHSCVMAAQEMGGELRAHSDGAGKGATFTLVIPVGAGLAVPAEAEA